MHASLIASNSWWRTWIKKEKGNMKPLKMSQTKKQQEHMISVTVQLCIASYNPFPAVKQASPNIKEDLPCILCLMRLSQPYSAITLHAQWFSRGALNSQASFLNNETKNWAVLWDHIPSPYSTFLCKADFEFYLINIRLSSLSYDRTRCVPKLISKNPPLHQVLLLIHILCFVIWKMYIFRIAVSI